MLSSLINVTVLRDLARPTPCAFDDPAEAIVYLLRQAGYRAALTSNSIAKGALNLIIGAGAPGTLPLSELRKVLLNTKSVVLNLEQIASGSFYITEDYLKFLSERVVFDYNNNNILSLREKIGEVRAVEFPLIPVPSEMARRITVRSISEKNRFLFYGALSNRRINLLQKIRDAGIEVDVATNLYGAKLGEAIQSSRAVLNFHFYENSSVFEAARCLRPVGLGASVISESSLKPKNIDWEQLGVVFSESDSLASIAQTTLANPVECFRRMQRMIDSLADRRWIDICVEAIEFAESEV